jgi:hypothetical protein
VVTTAAEMVVVAIPLARLKTPAQSKKRFLVLSSWIWIKIHPFFQKNEGEFEPFTYQEEVKQSRSMTSFLLTRAIDLS